MRSEFKREQDGQREMEGISNTLLGSLHGLISPKLADRNDVETFLQQPPPRVIPGSLRRQFSANGFLLWFAIAMSAFGILVSGVGASLDGDNPNSPRLFFLIFGPSLLAVGIAIAVGVIMLARRRLTLLKLGVVRSAIVTAVRESVFVSGNERVYGVTIQCLDEDEMTIETRLKGYPAHRARELQQMNAPIRVVQHPKNPTRVIPVDCYV